MKMIIPRPFYPFPLNLPINIYRLLFLYFNVSGIYYVKPNIP